MKEVVITDQTGGAFTGNDDRIAIESRQDVIRQVQLLATHLQGIAAGLNDRISLHLDPSTDHPHAGLIVGVDQIVF